MTPTSRRAAVWLGEVLVGHIWCHAQNLCVFTFDPSYQRLPSRPVLGARFEDMRRPRRYPSAVPTWFANLLPESALRALMLAQRGTAASDDFDLLVALGQDLPGNVRVTLDPTEENPPASELLATPADQTAEDRGVLKFSLAGVQMKFSMYVDGQLTFRLQGRRGQHAWIAKTPDAVHPHACENEFAIMTWARLSGITAPRIELVPVSRLEGLPPNLPMHGDYAYAIERYDRTLDARLHQEDFCQVLDRPPTFEGKYKRSSYEELAGLISRLCAGGEEAAVREFVRRVVFMAASGNGDAHLKNWSLLYPDGLNAQLAPAYDLMATVVYPQFAQDDLALPLSGSKRFQDVTRASFRGVARSAGISADRMLGWVDDAREQTREAWKLLGRDVLPELELPSGFVERLRQHMEHVPLLRGE